MANLFNSVGTFTTGIFTAANGIISGIVDNEVMAIFCLVIPLFGVAVGIVRKFTKRKG